MIESLLRNSKSSQLACIEIHNKPIFPFRYEVCVILNINSWELLLKAFILKNYTSVKVVLENGTTKPFEDCLAFVASQLGKSFAVAKENIEKLYEYRCNVIHFYQEDIDILLFSLLSKNVLLYHEFLSNHFDIDISNETNLVLLPIGFKKPVSPIEFLSNKSIIEDCSKAVKNFVKSIIKSTEAISNEGLEDSILYSFKMSLINENRIKNADVIAAITKQESKAAIQVENIISKFAITDDDSQEGVKKVKIDEETIFKTIYTQTYLQVIKTSKKIFSNFIQNSRFNKIMNALKGNPTFHKKRYLDVNQQSGGGKDYYTEKIYEELSKHYTLKSS